MKKLNKYLMLFVAALALVGCVDDVVETPSTEISANVGDEVQFGVSLPTTRTVYGDKTTTAYDLYWVDGDKVQIYSPQALEGRNNAEYKVIPTTDEDYKDKPYYADDLVITGENGVQWGEGDTRVINNVECTGVHDFYSVYPSGNYTFEPSDDDDKVMLAKGVRVRDMQTITYDGNTSFNDGFQYEMSNCLMYAYTPDVDKNKENVSVDLKYIPVSTVLEFELSAAKTNDATQDDKYMIMGITLSATSTIAGEFNLNVTNGSFDSWGGDNSKQIVIDLEDTSSGKTGKYTMNGGESIKIPVFLAPADLNINGWVISIVTDKGTYNKTLKNDDTGKTALQAGKIHKIKLPAFTPTEDGWDVATWMRYIPRNVYLSEISIPGSWNSLNPDFQGDNADIAKQYAKGVRAFHLDARWKAKYSGSWGSTAESTFSNFEMSVANGGGTREVGTWLGIGNAPRVMKEDAPTFESMLQEVVKNVKSDEYMVLFCSFAQDSYNNVSKTGKTWIQAVSDACDNVNNSSDVTLSGKIYDANELTSDTVVGDVLGKVIVIVNCENKIEDETLPEGSQCLFINIPNNLTSDYFPTSGFKSDNLHYSSGVEVDITMAVSQAQITSSTGSAITDGVRGYYPSFTQRTAVVNSILDWSKENYSDQTNYNHNQWIFLGLGGNTGANKSSTGDSNTSDEVLNVYSPLINNRIQAMKDSDEFYPVGIVYLNYTVAGSYTSNNTDWNTEQTVKNILMLNNLYQLQFDPTKDKYGNTIAGDTTTEGEEGGF